MEQQLYRSSKWKPARFSKRCQRMHRLQHRLRDGCLRDDDHHWFSWTGWEGSDGNVQSRSWCCHAVRAGDHVMHSKRSTEGYLLLDNRESPGISDDLLWATRLTPSLPMGAGRGMFEAPTVTCSHCQTVVVINPLRNRDREYCPSCDHYICDGCGAAKAQSGVCRTFEQIISEVQEQAVKGVLSHG